MFNTGIYEIVNTKNGCRYVGSALRMANRWGQHVAQLSEGRHHSRYLQRSWNKYGAASFRFSAVLWCAKEDLIHYEQTVMDALSPEYNVAPIAGSQLGYKHTEESRKKMKASRANTPSSAMKGRVHSEETRAKISQSRKGKGGDKGWTQERRDKISSAMKGRVITQDWRDKLSESLKGKKQSAETIAKRVERLRGRKMPEGFAEKTRQRMLGSKLSPETIEKMARSKSLVPDETVRKIRQMTLNKVSHREISRELGVGRATVADISCGRSYKWVNP